MSLSAETQTAHHTTIAKRGGRSRKSAAQEPAYMTTTKKQATKASRCRKAKVNASSVISQLFSNSKVRGGLRNQRIVRDDVLFYI